MSRVSTQRQRSAAWCCTTAPQAAHPTNSPRTASQRPHPLPCPQHAGSLKRPPAAHLAAVSSSSSTRAGSCRARWMSYTNCATIGPTRSSITRSVRAPLPLPAGPAPEALPGTACQGACEGACCPDSSTSARMPAAMLSASMGSPEAAMSARREASDSARATGRDTPGRRASPAAAAAAAAAGGGAGAYATATFSASRITSAPRPAPACGGSRAASWSHAPTSCSRLAPPSSCTSASAPAGCGGAAALLPTGGRVAAPLLLLLLETSDMRPVACRVEGSCW